MREENITAVDEQFSPAVIITIVQDVLRRWYLILAVALIAAMAAYVYTDYTYTPQYSTTTTFVATAGGTSTTTYQNLSAATNLASVFSEVLNSSLLRNKIVEQTGIRDFDGTVTAAAIAETNLLTMTVRGSDPRTVFLMTRAIIDHHDIVSYQVLGSTVLEVLQQPLVPVVPVNPLNLGSTVKKVVVIAVVFMCALLGFLAFREEKIRSKHDADTKLSCRVLGVLYHEQKYKTLREMIQRKKGSILITNPITSFTYTESVNKLASRATRRLHRRENVLMVTSLLENEGKSTVAVNMALSLARKGRKVLLIDCDLRKPACGMILNLPQKNAGTAEVILGEATLEECVKKLPNSGLHLLSARKSLRTATDLVSSPAMEALLKQASADYEYVVVDTPPMSLAPDAECISGFADATILVVRQNDATVEALNEAASILENASSRLLGCVLNNVYGFGDFAPAFSYGLYGSYGRYGRYGRYGKYGKYGYGRYGYGSYGYGHRREGSEKASANSFAAGGENE